MSDETGAVSSAGAGGVTRRCTCWLTGLVLVGARNGGTAPGVLLGASVGNPNALGPDVAFPAGWSRCCRPARHPARRVGRRGDRHGPHAAAAGRTAAAAAGS
ncbi:MAG TPA: hypothetical protein VHW44_15690 [Pseudonocardiaceae bacterium]|nr:hypothetical protein [Pseudonocardiaceae bacterium]